VRFGVGTREVTFLGTLSSRFFVVLFAWLPCFSSLLRSSPRHLYKHWRARKITAVFLLRLRTPSADFQRLAGCWVQYVKRFFFLRAPLRPSIHFFFSAFIEVGRFFHDVSFFIAASPSHCFSDFFFPLGSRISSPLPGVSCRVDPGSTPNTGPRIEGLNACRQPTCSELHAPGVLFRHCWGFCWEVGLVIAALMRYFSNPSFLARRFSFRRSRSSSPSYPPAPFLLFQVSAGLSHALHSPSVLMDFLFTKARLRRLAVVRPHRVFFSDNF